MAKRILSADSALVAHTQTSLGHSVRTETRSDFFSQLEARWRDSLACSADELLFSWEDQGPILREMAFINTVQARMDEAAVRIAPALLRIVLTVRENLPSPQAQKEYLAKHLELDFRRISELCIVGDSYGLLLPGQRHQGEKEIALYGWSKALKLAYVRDPADREMIWSNACAGRPSASYRAVLEEIKRFRERRLIGPPAPREEITTRLERIATSYRALNASPLSLGRPEDYHQTLRQVDSMRRELGRLKRVLQDQIVAVETEELAAAV